VFLLAAISSRFILNMRRKEKRLATLWAKAGQPGSLLNGDDGWGEAREMDTA